MNRDDLWMGESLRLKKSGRVGKYDGPAADGKVRVRLKDKTILTLLSNVEIYEEKQVSPLNISEEKISLKRSFSGPELDLHIEVLNPRLVGAPPVRILDFQVGMAMDFLEYAYDNRWLTIQLIHGKGEGVLKSEIHHLLNQQDFIKVYHTINDGGATEVWLETTRKGQ